MGGSNATAPDDQREYFLWHFPDALLSRGPVNSRTYARSNQPSSTSNCAEYSRDFSVNQKLKLAKNDRPFNVFFPYLAMW